MLFRGEKNKTPEPQVKLIHALVCVFVCVYESERASHSACLFLEK